MHATDSVIRHYIEKRLEDGAGHSIIFHELADMQINERQIKEAFEGGEGLHYKICPKKISEEEILSPLVDYIKALVKHSKPEKSRLLKELKKKGWTEQDFKKACRKLKINSGSFKSK